MVWLPALAALGRDTEPTYRFHSSASNACR